MHTQGGFGPRCCAIIDLDWREVAIGIAGNIANHGKLARVSFCAFRYKNWRTGTRKDAIQKECVFKDLWEWSATGGLCHIPFGHRNIEGAEEVRCTCSNAAKRTDDKRIKFRFIRAEPCVLADL